MWEAFLNAPGVQSPAAPSNFIDRRDQSTSFEDKVAYSTNPVSLTEAGEPEKAVALYTSDNFLRLLGVEPLLGRGTALKYGLRSTYIAVTYDRGRDHGPEFLDLLMNVVSSHLKGQRVKTILDLLPLIIRVTWVSIAHDEVRDDVNNRVAGWFARAASRSGNFRRGVEGCGDSSAGNLAGAAE